MKKYLLPILICSVLISAFSRKKDKTPWSYIFNGQDFTNWKLVGGKGVAVVKDSSFYCHMTANTKEHTFVCTKEKYGDFILELDVNADPGFNTGILLRCIDKPVDCDTCKVSLYGYQIKIDPSPTRCWTGGIFDDFGASWKWLYDLGKDARAQTAATIGKWNHFRVEAIGSSIKVWVNDIPTTNLVNNKYSSGYIALKIHSLNNFPEEENKIGRFKNIRIITSKLRKNARKMDLPPRYVN
jgi:hypothetical protein